MQVDRCSSASKCIVFVQILSFFSSLSLLKSYRRYGKLRVLYVTSNALGIGVSNLLYKTGVLSSRACQIVREEIYPVDSSDNKAHVMKTETYNELSELYQTIFNLVEKTISNADNYYCNLLVANILKKCNEDLRNAEQQRLVHYARKMMQKTNSNVVIILRPPLVRGYEKMIQREKDWIDSGIIYQFTFSNSVIATIASLLYRIIVSMVPSSPGSTIAKDQKSVGIAACWGLDQSKQNDLFWWNHTDIKGSRLKYLFDRNDYQPTLDIVSRISKQGFTPIAMNRNALGEVPSRYYRQRVSLVRILQVIRTLLRILILALRSDILSRDILLVLMKDLVSSLKLERQYKALGLAVLWHYQESGPDHITSAIHLAGGIRLGTHWSCADSPNTGNMRTPHVYFLWGAHDARICIESRSISQQLVIAGCAISEMNIGSVPRDETLRKASSARDKGAEIVLVLFDNSTRVTNFYKYFLQWMLDDSRLGVLIKPKKINMRIAHSELDNLFSSASATGRMHILDPYMWPGDAAKIGDFCIGLGTMSAVAVSALAGARTIYLDYARLNHNPLTKPYTTLDSLGSDRCVFYDHETLQTSISQYLDDPLSKPYLGDATPVLDQFDPFRDGKARQRIGEYVKCYVENIDKGKSREHSLTCASMDYAEKWGEDKVVLGL